MSFLTKGLFGGPQAALPSHPRPRPLPCAVCQNTQATTAGEEKTSVLHSCQPFPSLLLNQDRGWCPPCDPSSPKALGLPVPGGEGRAALRQGPPLSPQPGSRSSGFSFESGALLTCSGNPGAENASGLAAPPESPGSSPSLPAGRGGRPCFSSRERENVQTRARVRTRNARPSHCQLKPCARDAIYVCK